MPIHSRTALVLPLVAGLACGGTTPAPSTAPAPAPAPSPAPATARPAAAPALPDIPLVDGPLAVRIQYPSPNQQLTSRDSNFIFGSIGSGRAALTVNGVPARVYNNGAFMAFLANPPVTAPRYMLVASRGTDTARATLGIRLSPSLPAPLPEATVVKPEMCGLTYTSLRRQSGERSGSGSVSKTSSAAART